MLGLKGATVGRYWPSQTHQTLLIVQHASSSVVHVCAAAVSVDTQLWLTAFAWEQGVLVGPPSG